MDQRPPDAPSLRKSPQQSEPVRVAAGANAPLRASEFRYAEAAKPDSHGITVTGLGGCCLHRGGDRMGG